MSEISRRKFLQGALLAGAGAAGAGALAACSPQTAENNNAGSSGAAGTKPVDTFNLAANIPAGGEGNFPFSAGAYPWPATPPTIAAEDIEDEIDCDVAVAGCSISGSCAVRAAAEAGAKVVFFEKGSQVQSFAGDMAVINGKVQARWGRDGVYDIDEVCDHEMDEGSNFAKRAIWRKWAEEGHTVFDWYIGAIPEDEWFFADNGDSYGDGATNWVRPNFYPDPPNYNYKEEAHPCFVTSVRLSQETVNPACVTIATDEYGAQGYFGHAVRQLITEGNDVVGCYAYNYETGKYKKVNTTKGVVLACGDYLQNDVLTSYFLPDCYKNPAGVMGGGIDTEGEGIQNGDGLIMGDWAGAAIQQHHGPMIHHMGQGYTDPDAPAGDMESAMANMSPIGAAPFLRLNILGKRFMCEDLPGQQCENQIEVQPQQRCIMLWDGKWLEAVPYFPVSHGVPIMVAEEGAELAMMGMSTNQTAMDEAVAGGGVKKADTLKEVLGNFYEGASLDAAIASVERYNQLCDNGYDADFGKKATRMTPVRTAPFYGFNIGLANNLCNIGGLVSDEDCHTFSKVTGQIIKGLYVAGSMQGSKFTVQYPIAMEGAASSLAMWGGYVAGTNVAKGV